MATHSTFTTVRSATTAAASFISTAPTWPATTAITTVVGAVKSVSATLSSVHHLSERKSAGLCSPSAPGQQQVQLPFRMSYNRTISSPPLITPHPSFLILIKRISPRAGDILFYLHAMIHYATPVFKIITAHQALL